MPNDIPYGYYCLNTYNLTTEHGIDILVGQCCEQEWIDKSDCVEVWASCFDRPGPDDCLIRYIKNGEIIHTATIPGF